MGIKNNAKTKIESFLDSYQSKDFHASPTGKQRWQGIISYMMSEDWSHKLPSTIEYLETCDRTRGTDFRKVFPNLRDL